MRQLKKTFFESTIEKNELKWILLRDIFVNYIRTDPLHSNNGSTMLVDHHWSVAGQSSVVSVHFYQTACRGNHSNAGTPGRFELLLYDCLSDVMTSEHLEQF